MSTSRDATPEKFKCGVSLQCPSVHIAENGDYVLIGNYASQGELATMGIKEAGQGESAIRWTPEFMDAFFMEYAARKLQGAK